jgi:hypothetical protein
MQPAAGVSYRIDRYLEIWDGEPYTMSGRQGARRLKSRQGKRDVGLRRRFDVLGGTVGTRWDW